MSYIPLPQDINGNVLVSVNETEQDVVGNIITAQRNTSIVATFAESPVTDLTTLISVAGTGGGAGTLSSGNAIFSTGSGTTSSITGQTYTSVTYNPGFEVHTSYSVTYTTPTSANSSQFIGVWDIVNNGFYIGYNGTTFGSAVMNGGVETFTNRTAWNGDLLNGNSQSKFTRNGVPEAIVLTNLNLYRIRYSWWGSSPILYEVLSPDNEWVIFHRINQPNTSPSPPVRTPNLPISLKITKTGADSTDLIMKSGSWTAGTTAPIAVDVVNYINTTWTSATSANSTLETSALGAGSINVSIVNTGTISAGAVTIEATPDGSTWFPLNLTNPTGTPVGLFSTYPLATGNFSTNTFIGGFLKVRARLSTAITGSGSTKILLRPSLTGVTRFTQVYQPTGTNLHTVIDSGTVTTTNSSSTGNAPTAVSVGVTSATAVASNSSRKGLVLTNTSNRVISLGLNGNAAVLNSGITLQAGGVWVMDSYTFTTGAITAIASGAASNLAIQEMQ